MFSWSNLFTHQKTKTVNKIIKATRIQITLKEKRTLRKYFG